MEEEVHVVTTPTETSLPRNNRAFHRLLMDGVKVEFTNAQGEKETDHAQLIDFQNPAKNDFLVVNQFTVTGTRSCGGRTSWRSSTGCRWGSSS